MVIEMVKGWQMTNSSAIGQWTFHRSMRFCRAEGEEGGGGGGGGGCCESSVQHAGARGNETGWQSDVLFLKCCCGL